MAIRSDRLVGARRLVIRYLTAMQPKKHSTEPTPATKVNFNTPSVQTLLNRSLYEEAGETERFTIMQDMIFTLIQPGMSENDTKRVRELLHGAMLGIELMREPT